MINRSKPHSVALETTLLVHGVPKDAAQVLARDLEDIVSSNGAHAATVGIVDGEPVVGLSAEELSTLLAADHVEKANTANLGVLMHRGLHGATTVSTTMELAAQAHVRVFATGAIGGVHQDYGTSLDISADLAALTRFPVAVVTSGVKSILDVNATREALETLGVTVVGYQTDRFPAFYLRESDRGVDARFDDPIELAAFIDREMNRSGRGVVIANPIPSESELDHTQWTTWLSEARTRVEALGAHGRDSTPALLGALHEISNGATLDANLALVRSNASLASQIAACWRP